MEYATFVAVNSEFLKTIFSAGLREGGVWVERLRRQHACFRHVAMLQQLIPLKFGLAESPHPLLTTRRNIVLPESHLLSL
jgi:hypothetical protein